MLELLLEFLWNKTLAAPSFENENTARCIFIFDSSNAIVCIENCWSKSGPNNKILSKRTFSYIHNQNSILATVVLFPTRYKNNACIPILFSFFVKKKSVLKWYKLSKSLAIWFPCLQSIILGSLDIQKWEIKRLIKKDFSQGTSNAVWIFTSDNRAQATFYRQPE